MLVKFEFEKRIDFIIVEGASLGVSRSALDINALENMIGETKKAPRKEP